MTGLQEVPTPPSRCCKLFPLSILQQRKRFLHRVGFPIHMLTLESTPSAPTVAGTTKSCSKYHEVKTGDTCADISIANAITLSELLSLNQKLNDQCSNLLSGYAYCVATVNGTATDSTPTTSSVVTPTPVQEGLAKNCNEFYRVESGDGCYDIANDHSIPLDDFYDYNLAVGNDCSKLYPDTYVCISVTQSCTVSVSFKTTHSTEWGESIWVVGSLPELGVWDTSKALMLTGSSGADSTTNWEVSADLPSDMHVSYKFIKLQTDGTPVWEERSNREFDTSSCSGPKIQEGGKWQTGSPSCITIDVVFETQALTSYSEAVYVLGSVLSLGQWSANAAVALSAAEYSDSNLSGKALSIWRSGKTSRTSSSRLASMAPSHGKRTLTGSSPCLLTAVQYQRKVGNGIVKTRD